MKKTEIKQADTRKSTSLLKKHLKELFGIDVKIKSESYSGGCSLNIKYTLGPDEKEVEKVVSNLQYGSFNSYEDLWEHTTTEGIIVDGYKLQEFKHVFVRQEWSDEFSLKLCQFAMTKIKFGDLEAPKDLADFTAYKPEVFEYQQGCSTLSNLLYRHFQVSHFATQDESKIELLDCKFSEKHNGQIYFIYSVDGIEYNTEELPVIAKEEKTQIEKIEVQPGKIQVIEYSDKAIAVIGDTKPIKDKLKELGGKFNFRLSCGAGWIFSKNKLEEIKNALIVKEVANV